MLFDASEIWIQRGKCLHLKFSFEDYLLLSKDREDSMWPINVWEISQYDRHCEYKVPFATDEALFQGTIWGQVLLWYAFRVSNLF